MSDYRKAYDGIKAGRDLRERLREIPDGKAPSRRKIVPLIVTAVITFLMTVFADIVCYAVTDESIVGNIMGKQDETAAEITINGEPVSSDMLERTDSGYVIRYRPEQGEQGEVVVRISGSPVILYDSDTKGDVDIAVEQDG